MEKWNENLTFYFQRNWFSFHNVFICFFVSYKFCFVNQGTCSLKNKLNKVFCISTLSITSYFIFCIYFAKNNYYILNWVSYCNNRIKTPSFKFQTIHKKIIKTFKKISIFVHTAKIYLMYINFIKVLPAETLAIFRAGFPVAFSNTVRNMKKNKRNVRQSFIFLLDMLLL